MSQACPCCGQALPADLGFRIDEAGIVLAGGRFARLTEHEAAVLAKLAEKPGRVISKDQLMAAVYWAADEDPHVKIIDVWICKMRPRLKPLGVVIETVWGRGYRLLPSNARTT